MKRGSSTHSVLRAIATTAKGLAVKAVCALTLIGSVQLGSSQWVGRHFMQRPATQEIVSRVPPVFHCSTVINPLGLPVQICKIVNGA